jgi:nucleoside-diphosphate-sugar epimerase
MPELSNTRSVFIVGCGDIGRRVAALESAQGGKVIALARSEASAEKLTALGMEVIRGDLDGPDPLPQLPCGLDALYHFAPPPPSGTGDPRLENLLTALAPSDERPRRVVYISTSGVYGDCGGAWVDETWPRHPQTDRARRRVAAEILWQAWAESHDTPLAILRVPGIYGPGRLPVERIRLGTPVVAENESPWSNRIHADDLAQACFAAAQPQAPTGPFNISDGHPTTMTDYFNRLADLLGLPRPPAVSMDEARQVLSPAMLSFLEESKRLDNRRMLEELGVQLRFPDLDAGLATCIRESPSPRGRGI